MAIYWVDPYIGSVAGNATGTTDTTTRNGTYAAPLKFTDIYSTSTGVAPTYNGISFSAGDEIRIKGLTDAQWKIPLSDTWYLTTNSPSETTFRTITKSGNIPAAYLGSSPTKRPILWVDSCPGFGGEYAIFPTQYTYDQGTYYQHSGGSAWWIGYCYPIMGTANFTASLVNWDYALPSPPAAWYLFQNMAVNVSITDGWTDATTQGGKTWWLMSFAGTNTVYIGYNNNGNTGTAYTLDLSNSHFCFPNSSSQTLNMYIYAAIGQTVKVGSVSSSYISSSPAVNLYYSASSNISLATVLGPAYGVGRSAWSSTPTGAVVTTRNSAGGYYWGIPGTAYVGETWKIRCCVGGGGGSSATQLSALTGQTIEFLAGSILRPFSTLTGLFSGTLPTVTGVVPARTFTGCPTLSAAVLATPAYAISQSMTSAADFIYSGLTPLDAADFTKIVAYSFAAQYNLEDVYRWAMLTDPRDYRTVDLTAAASTVVTGEAARGIHFASNAYDTKPIGLIFSPIGKGILIYNEATQNNALAFQSATAALGENYYKRLPLNLPAYAGASTGVRFDFEYATSSDFTTGEMGVQLVAINGSAGLEIVEPLLGGAGAWTLSGVQTSPATMQYVIPKTWLTSNAVTQLQVKLRFKSGSGVGKLFVRAMNLTVV